MPQLASHSGIGIFRITDLLHAKLFLRPCHFARNYPDEPSVIFSNLQLLVSQSIDVFRPASPALCLNMPWP